MTNQFKSTQDAFEYLYSYITDYGVPHADTLAVFNAGFLITDPLAIYINTPWRKWSQQYAEREYRWYMDSYFTKNPSGIEIARHAPIWFNHLDEHGNLQSNYGWQWSRNDQIAYVVGELGRDPNSRRAVLTMYDGKEHGNYQRDTPCTISIQFQILDGKLCMTVTMRSNDLWFGFCNDAYTFSKLHYFIAHQLDIPMGGYYHFASNLHLYNKHLNLNTNGTI